MTAKASAAIEINLGRPLKALLVLGAIASADGLFVLVAITDYSLIDIITLMLML